MYVHVSPLDRQSWLLVQVPLYTHVPYCTYSGYTWPSGTNVHWTSIHQNHPNHCDTRNFLKYCANVHNVALTHKSHGGTRQASKPWTAVYTYIAYIHVAHISRKHTHKWWHTHSYAHTKMWHTYSYAHAKMYVHTHASRLWLGMGMCMYTPTYCMVVNAAHYIAWLIRTMRLFVKVTSSS